MLAEIPTVGSPTAMFINSSGKVLHGDAWAYDSHDKLGVVSVRFAG
jgi:hypothetical protein